MKILLILSVCVNFYLLILHRQQATALQSLRGLDGQNASIIRKLKKEFEAQIQKSRSNKAYEPKKAPILYG